MSGSPDAAPEEAGREHGGSGSEEPRGSREFSIRDHPAVVSGEASLSGAPAGSDDLETDPEPTRPEELLGRRPDAARLATQGLFLLAFLYTLYFAKPVVLPFVLAVLLAFVLDPIVGAITRLRIPRALAAGIVIVGLAAATGYGIVRLAGPATDWLEEAPRSFEELETKLAGIKKPVEDVERATEEMQKITQIGEEDGATEVRVEEPSLVSSGLDRVRRSLSGALLTIVLVGFFLASGDLFLRKFVRLLPSLRAKKRMVNVTDHVRTEISTYLLTMGAINVGLGVAVGVAMWLLDVPNPLLWGVMAGCLNFVPYLGPFVGMVVVGLASVLSFDTLGQAAIPPLVYLALNSIEGSFVTPAILGRRLALNPIAVLVSLMIWGWMWGIPGALMAVPLVVAIKIVCDHYEPWAGFGELLGRA